MGCFCSKQKAFEEPKVAPRPVSLRATTTPQSSIRTGNVSPQVHTRGQQSQSLGRTSEITIEGQVQGVFPLPDHRAGYQRRKYRDLNGKTVAQSSFYSQSHSSDYVRASGSGFGSTRG